MRAINALTRISVLNYFGNCGKCIRTSFGMALLSSIVFIFSTIYSGSSYVNLLIAAIFVLSAANWATHILMYALRGATAYMEKSNEVYKEDLSRRRDIIKILYRGAVYAVIFPALPLLKEAVPGLFQTVRGCPQGYKVCDAWCCPDKPTCNCSPSCGAGSCCNGICS